MDPVISNLGKIIAELRRKKKLSQEAVANRLHVTRQAVSRWEKGDNTPNPDTLRALAALFDVTVDTLLGIPAWDGIDGDSVYRSYANIDDTVKPKKKDPSLFKRLRVGVFGAVRGIAMIHIILKHPDAELAAVCDRSEAVREEVLHTAKSYGVEDLPIFSDFDDFLACDMDAVILTNCANEHVPFAIRCLKAGKHVLSEVQACETPAQAVALIEAVEEAGLVYAYAENYCYMSHTFEMQKRYRSGELGRVLYAEGEYIHDCSSIWPRLTHGDREHWRNTTYANFYCSHSLAPILTITGLRPVAVNGFEMPPSEDMRSLGCPFSSGIEMVTLEGGAKVKSIHGYLKRTPGSVNYQLYCERGMMETGRLAPSRSLNLYKEGAVRCQGHWEQFEPVSDIMTDLAKECPGHGGSDLYPVHFFLEKILGRPGGAYSIDVYTAVDISLCGIFAHRSMLEGGNTLLIPNLRLPEERDAWRHDNACTNPAVAGDALLPRTSYPGDPIPDSVYENVRAMWLRDDDA